MVTVERLSAKYPLLWHMADPRNIPGILERGLLSTSTLLDLLALDEDVRATHERQRRPDDVVLEHPRHGTIVLRDQKPLSLARLAKALTEGTVGDFLAFVNGRTFFWPTEERLATMNGARAYVDRPQLVFVVRSYSLLATHWARVLLSRINSGSTTRFAAKRSIATFQPPAGYDWSAGKRHVAEITVAGGAPDIWQHVERLEVWKNGLHVKRVNRPWNATLQGRALH